MGKKEDNIGDGKSSKKTKIHKESIDDIGNDPIADMEIEQEEIVCDGEMEVPQVDVTICIDEPQRIKKTTQNESIEPQINKIAVATRNLESPKTVVNKALASRKQTKKSSTKTEASKSPKPTLANKISTSKKQNLGIETNSLEAVTKNVTQNVTAEGDDLESPKPSTSKAASLKKSVPANASTTKKPKKPRRESGTSSEEERWLTALESGKLLDVDDELKKMKDPKLMTARQRAMYNNDDDEPSPGVETLLSLPSGYREKEKPQTAEEIQKAALKIQRRRQQADERRERDKKKTMERLLKKQESRQRSARSKMSKTVVPMIRYKNTMSGASIQMPLEHEFPMKAQQPRNPPKVQLCGIAGCNQPKVYNCSKTNLPLCSLVCYKKNVQALRQIMC